MEGLTAADPQAVGEFRLGAGGMGQVFLATSPGGRMVAVKVIHPELARDSEFVRRFRAEVEAARRVSGMYTAPVVAAGVDDRPPWLATAFVPGPSLADIVSRYGPLPVPALWRLAAASATSRTPSPGRMSVPALIVGLEEMAVDGAHDGEEES
jgi:hypothetical protein